MVASRIEARAVFKVIAIVLVAIGVALLLEHVIVEVQDDDPLAVRGGLPRARR